MKPVKIIIDDENRYFAAGLRHSITEYARANKKSVYFLTMGSMAPPDIVLTSVRRRAQRWRRAGNGASVASIVMIKERPVNSAGDINGVLYRSDNQCRLFELLTEILSSVQYPVNERRTLTARERQVMGYMRHGFDQSQVARIMGVSVKTVHSHKRSVMGKLMLYRNHELLYWLLSQEGELS
ncbi:TPA: response regulator transcription factor [Serratia marcescens]|uniref:response regulator transcription factor n=1 Tax=Serratia marcescens TaxID=615 RepID=UPI0029C2E272|nr:helix-turn-helix transcriptional regulator [Serratia marcescens]